MEFLQRGFRFLRRYFFTNPRYVLSYLAHFWWDSFTFNVKLMSEDEFIDHIKDGKSLIRIGDGEVNLMLGLKNHYQIFSPFLQKEMFNIVQMYSDKSPYILSVPRFVNTSNKELKSMGKFQVWMPLKVMFGIYFNKSITYLDAHSFYYDEYLERTIGQAIVNKKVVLITKEATINKQSNNKKLPWPFFATIIVPEEESLDSYAAIESEIERVVVGVDKKELVLLFAMGPVGKVMIYKFASKGVQSIDIGKAAEVMYTGESISYIV